MQKFIRIYKPIGITPLELIHKFKSDNPEYQDQKISYAGRLDPLAHGEMILLIGEENKQREKYLNLNKEYEFDVLIGLATDTYDILGLLQMDQTTPLPSDWKDTTRKYLEQIIGRHFQPYPAYSTKPVNGKSLFQWAKEGKLSQIQIPTKEIEIYSANYLSNFEITSANLEKLVKERINLVSGDFRQKEIIQIWHGYFRKNGDQIFNVAKLKVRCSSGTYVRSIAYNLGKYLGSGAIALDIKRTRIEI